MPWDEKMNKRINMSDVDVSILGHDYVVSMRVFMKRWGHESFQKKKKKESGFHRI